MNKEIEMLITEFPIYEYCFIDTNELVFDNKIRYVCENECSMYNKRWHCPPVCGSVEDCQKRVLAYSNSILFSTVWEADSMNMTELFERRREHEKITFKINQKMEESGYQSLVLSTGCMPCKECTYPDAPCRKPDTAFPTIESHGIVLTSAAEKQSMTINLENGVVLYFSLICFDCKRI